MKFIIFLACITNLVLAYKAFDLAEFKLPNAATESVHRFLSRKGILPVVVDIVVQDQHQKVVTFLGNQDGKIRVPIPAFKITDEKATMMVVASYELQGELVKRSFRSTYDRFTPDDYSNLQEMSQILVEKDELFRGTTVSWDYLQDGLIAKCTKDEDAFNRCVSSTEGLLIMVIMMHKNLAKAMENQFNHAHDKIEYVNGIQNFDLPSEAFTIARKILNLPEVHPEFCERTMKAEEALKCYARPKAATNDAKKTVTTQLYDAVSLFVGVLQKYKQPIALGLTCALLNTICNSANYFIEA